MKILVYCPTFFPSVGGLEINVAQLAEGFHAAGHEVVVVATTENLNPEPFAFRVVRGPSRLELLRLVRWCDVFFQANVSLRGLWPLLLVRRPWVVSHQGWYGLPDGTRSPQDRLKRFLVRWGRSISASQAVADDLGTPSTVIPNAYRDDIFRPLADVARDRDLIFVGRLVSDKGVTVLLEAFGILARRGIRTGLTIVGDGPEREALEAQAGRLGIDADVHFLGMRSAEEIVRLLNAHRILVVPSLYNEPFGIVALEGIACGCLVIGSRGGGLKEAIGTCGLTFSNSDSNELASVLATAIAHPDRFPYSAEVVAEHLLRHKSQTMVGGYLRVIESALARMLENAT